MTDDILKNIVDEQPYPIIFASLSGAHLYSFPSPDSDYDVRGVHCLPLRDILGLHGIRET
ncbi:MAG: nucleotidyltransferase domain-containing protein, partial [Chloroflexota bacterium]